MSVRCYVYDAEMTLVAETTTEFLRDELRIPHPHRLSLVEESNPLYPELRTCRANLIAHDGDSAIYVMEGV